MGGNGIEVKHCPTHIENQMKINSTELELSHAFFFLFFFFLVQNHGQQNLKMFSNKAALEKAALEHKKDISNLYSLTNEKLDLIIGHVLKI